MLKVVLPFSLFSFLCLVFLTLFLIEKNKNGSSHKSVTLKTIASIMFVFGGVYALTFTGALANMLIVFGLVLAMIGDIILDLRCMKEDTKKFYFHVGASSFSLSAALYFAATMLLWHSLENFVLLSVGSVALAIVFTIIIQLLEKPMKFDFSGNRVMISIYSFCISLATFAALAIGVFANGFLVFAVGILLVLLSDLVLSMMYFGGKENNKLLCTVNHVVYYAGELLVMAYLFFQLF